MSRLTPWIGGTRRLVGHVGQYGLLLGPFRRALVEPAAAASRFASGKGIVTASGSGSWASNTSRPGSVMWIVGRRSSTSFC